MELRPSLTPLVEYRAQFETYDELMGVPIKRFSSMEDLQFDPHVEARYIVNDPRYSLPVDVLLVPRRDSKRLLVGLHGAEGRANADLPKFQFVRSFKTRSESLMFIADSTLLQGNEINIGWYAGNRDTPLAALAAEAVRKAGEALKIDETLLLGHSAGGFGAVVIGTMVPNSRAISVNGQTVVDRYEPWTVRNLRTFAFPDCETEEEMMARYGDRLDLRVALENRLDSSSFAHYANLSDEVSFGRLPHFPLLAEHFGITGAGGITSNGDALVVCDWHMEGVSGHAMPGTALPFLTLVLGEGNGTVPLNNEVSPLWVR